LQKLTRRIVLGGLSSAVVGSSWPLCDRAYAQASGAGLFETADPGLVPGSPGDQSQELSRALLKAEADNRPLFLPPGDYEIAEVTTPSYAHLVGVPGQTRLVFRGGRFMLKAQHARSLRLQGVTLDGAMRPIDMDARALLEAEDVVDVAVENSRVTGSRGAGLWLRETAGRVSRSVFSNIRTVGIDVDQSRGIEVTQNRVSDCGDTGILVERDTEGSDNSIVSGNHVTGIRADSGGSGQNGNGINLDKANGVIVSGNRIDQCAFSAIRCYSSDGISVTGNIATRSGETALYVEFAFEGAVVADNLVDGATDGISFANFLEYGGRLGTCSGNVVRRIRGGPELDSEARPQAGAGIAVEADVAVTGNVVEDAVWGLQLGWGPNLRDVAATGNVIRRTRIGIAVSAVEGGGPALISDNLISEAEYGGILGMHWHEVVTKELGNEDVSIPRVLVSGNKIT
jgi:uncharacterized secreted repeat protein (TIGR03808 family)